LCTDDDISDEDDTEPQLKQVRVDLLNVIILADVEEEEDPHDEDPLGQDDIINVEEEEEEEPLGQDDIIDEEEEEPLGQDDNISDGEEPPPKIKRVSVDLRNVRILYFLSLNCTVKIVTIGFDRQVRN
jgi:hypothetical protein